MKYIDAELIKSTKGLYNDIDSCIDELLKARVGHNQENEGKALFRMEGLMVATLQQLDCIIDSLQQEQSEVDLNAEIEKELRLHYNDDQDVYWWNYLKNSFRHFYELGQSTKYQQDREEFAKLKAREWINGYDEGYAKGLNAKKEENK